MTRSSMPDQSATDAADSKLSISRITPSLSRANAAPATGPESTPAVRTATGKRGREAPLATIAAISQNSLMKDIADLRKSYERAELDETHAAGTPLRQFEQWMQEALAAKLPEPTAMTLATVGPEGQPSTRVVLLKGCDARGFVWYTNYASRKAQEIAGNPQAALQFHWVELERVARIEGRVEKTDAAESDAYFRTRPLDSRIGAWASPQSRVIPSRAVLVTEAARIGAKFLLDPPRPPHWGGYRLFPDTFEFWQGRRSRLHDRLRYALQADGSWLRQRLAP